MHLCSYVRHDVPSNSIDSFGERMCIIDVATLSAMWYRRGDNFADSCTQNRDLIFITGLAQVTGH